MVLFRSLVLLFVCQVQSANILGIFPHAGRSHHLAFEPLLRKLAKRGHQVTIASFFPLKEPMENYTDVSFQGLNLTVGKEPINLSWFEKQNTLLDRLGLNIIWTQMDIFQRASKKATEICALIVDYAPLAAVFEKDYDVIIIENFNSDCVLGLLHIYGVKTPVISLLSSPMLPWSASRIGVCDNPSYVPIITSDYTSSMTFLQRMENTVMSAYYKQWFYSSIQVTEKMIIEKQFKRKIPDLEDLAKNIIMLLVNTFHSLNGVRPMLPGVVEVGGMHLEPKKAVIPQVQDTCPEVLMGGQMTVAPGKTDIQRTTKRFQKHWIQLGNRYYEEVNDD